MRIDRTLEAVRYETEQIGQSVNVLSRIVHDVRDYVAQYFGLGRRMSEEALRDLVAGIHDTISSELRPIRVQADMRRPTAVRPKSDAYELLYVSVMQEDQCEDGPRRFFRLTSLRAFATRKKVVLECRPTALGLREHAAFRFLTRGADASAAVRELASAIADWAALPGIVEDAMESIGFERLGIPAPRGMLLGYLDQTAAIPSIKRFHFGRDWWGMEEEPVSPLVPATFAINTYIGPGQIHPNQIAAMDLMDRWKASCGPSFSLACDDVFWPERELRPTGNATIDDDKVAEIRALMVEGRMLRAMGNKRVAVRLRELAHLQEVRACPIEDADVPVIAMR
jgi:hypothetical protein